LAVVESHQTFDQRMPLPNQLLQQSLPAQQNFQTPSLSLSAPSAPYVPNSSSNPRLDQPVSSFDQPVSTGIPVLQRPPYNQSSFGNNMSFVPAQSVSPTLPSSIYPPMASQASQGPQITYKPVIHHWFYSVIRESRENWEPFSANDSLKIEEFFISGKILSDWFTLLL